MLQKLFRLRWSVKPPPHYVKTLRRLFVTCLSPFSEMSLSHVLRARVEHEPWSEISRCLFGGADGGLTWEEASTFLFDLATITPEEFYDTQRGTLVSLSLSKLAT